MGGIINRLVEGTRYALILIGLAAAATAMSYATYAQSAGDDDGSGIMGGIARVTAVGIGGSVKERLAVREESSLRE